VDKKPLYNSRIIRVFVEYLETHHPEVDICALLDHAGITMYALHDGAHWFTQGEVDRFYDIALSKTKMPGWLGRRGVLPLLQREQALPDST